MIAEKIIAKYVFHSYYTPGCLILATILTEGVRQDILFFLGAAAALCTIAARLYDIYLKGKAQDKLRVDKTENKADAGENENKL